MSKTINNVPKSALLRKNKSLVRQITAAAVIAALYTALSMAFAPLTFANIQVRFAEALTILPVFTPVAIPGLALGCALTNLFGVMTGANIAGVLDIPIGTAATLLAAICTGLLRKIRVGGLPVLSVLPPIIFNMFIIGAELSIIWDLPFWLTVSQVGLGQLISCAVIGLSLCAGLLKTRFAQSLEQL